MKTINLLPKSRQQELRYESLLHSLWVVFSLSLASFGLVFLAQFATKFYLQAEAKSLSAQISQTKDLVSKNQSSTIKQQIQNENNVISDYKNLADAAPKWSNALKAFASLPPAGVQINSLSMNSTDNSVNITGFSPTRDLVIQLYNNILQDNKDFYNIDYPLENLVNPVNVSFHFTFYMQPKLLQ